LNILFTESGHAVLTLSDHCGAFAMQEKKGPEAAARPPGQPADADPLPGFLVLLLSDALVQPPADPGLKERLRRRVLSRVRASIHDAEQGACAAQPEAPPKPVVSPNTIGLMTLRADEGAWVEILPKVHARLLFTDGTSQSYLMRLEPGAKNGPHAHADVEECLVLSGRIDYADGTWLVAGDYQVAMDTAVHSAVRSDAGALLFLRYAQPIERYLSA
jgi:quercetin dioxygenase-like cupin family protein